jgi:hypothetical protein
MGFVDRSNEEKASRTSEGCGASRRSSAASSDLIIHSAHLCELSVPSSLDTTLVRCRDDEMGGMWETETRKKEVACRSETASDEWRQWADSKGRCQVHSYHSLTLLAFPLSLSPAQPSHRICSRNELEYSRVEEIEALARHSRNILSDGLRREGLVGRDGHRDGQRRGGVGIFDEVDEIGGGHGI